MALALMARAQLPIDTITTVYGNSVVANSTRNAGYIAHCLGAQWQIYQGAAKPLRGEGRLAKGCHGESGLGDFVPPDHMVLPAQPEPASAFFAKIAQGKEVYTLFCLGPLTNIAEAFIQNPGIVNNIGRLVIMGGAFSKQGNATKDAEFNVYNDPLAFQTVLNEAQQAEIDTTVIPAEVCENVVLTKGHLSLLKKGNLLPGVSSIVRPYIDHYLKRARNNNYAGAVLYDVLVPLYYQYPDLFTARSVGITVAQHGKEYGKTVATSDGQSSVKICTSVNEEAQAIVLRTLGRPR